MDAKPKTQRLGSYALVKHDGHVLLCRLCHGSGKGLWTLPGGGVEFGEHPADAVVRETLEETGYQVRAGALRKVTSQVEGGHLHHVQFYYDAEIVGGELTAEVEGSTDLPQWFTPQEAQDLPRVYILERALALMFE